MATRKPLKLGTDGQVAQFEDSDSIAANTVEATVVTGTAPFTVASTTVVPNLNADQVDGIDASSFVRNDSVAPATQVIQSDFAVGWGTATGNYGGATYFAEAPTSSSTGPLVFDVYFDGFRMTTNPGGVTKNLIFPPVDGAVLTTADEGSGNGLDADTVDGIDSLGFVQNNITRQAALDANLAIGENKAFKPGAGSTNLPSGANYYGTLLNFNNGGDTNQQLYLEHGQDSDSDFWFRSDGIFTMNAPWRKVLTDADEGAGNGLDADTVDTIHASQFLRRDAINNLTAPAGFVLPTDSTFHFGNSGRNDGTPGYWYSFQIGGPTITESGGNVYPRAGFFWESSTPTDPTDLTFKISPFNTGGLKANVEVESFNDGDIILSPDGTGNATVHGDRILTTADESLLAINKIANTNTIIDVFIYDTSKDDDMGLWTDKATTQVWYSETLNTAVRGSIRDFPKLVIIIVELNKITLYDATDRDCPMWMVFNTGAGYAIGGSDLSSATAKNGVLVVSGYGSGLHVIDFINDKSISHNITSSYLRNNNILGRNSGSTFIDLLIGDLPSSQTTESVIVSDGSMNNIIYTATIGGLSRIAIDGTTSEWTDLGGSVKTVGKVNVVDGYVYFSIHIDRHIMSYPANIPLVDTAWYSEDYLHFSGLHTFSTDDTALAYHYGGIHSVGRSITNNVVSSDRGLTKLYPNPDDWGKSMIANIATNFNSGIMYGDIQGAWLADTQKNPEIVVDGTLIEACGVNWSCGGEWSIANNTATMVETSNYSTLYQLLENLTIGEPITISFDVLALTNTCKLDLTNVDNILYDISSLGRHNVTVIPTSTVVGLSFARQSQPSAMSINNISVKVSSNVGVDETTHVKPYDNSQFGVITAISSPWYSVQDLGGSSIFLSVISVNSSAWETIRIPYNMEQYESYEITITINNYVSGNVYVYISTTYIGFITGQGTFTVSGVNLTGADYFQIGTGTANLDYEVISIIGTGNKVINGDFNGSFDAGWTEANGASLSIESGRLRVTNTGTSYPFAIQTISGLVIGETYVFSGEAINGTAPARIDIDHDGVDGNGNGNDGLWTFVATSTTVNIQLYAEDITTGHYADFDNISLRLADADRSYKNNGLAVHGIIEKAPVAIGAELVWYSGFSVDNFLQQEHNDDLNFGTGSFYASGHFNEPTNLALNGIIFDKWDGVSTERLYTDVHGSTGNFRLRVNGINHLVLKDFRDGINHSFVVYRLNDFVYIYIDDVLELSEVEIGNVTHADHVLRIGTNMTNTAWNIGSLALIKIGAIAPTYEQALLIHEQEKPLFNDNSKCTLQGSSSDVVAVDYEEESDIVTACAGLTITKFKGLVAISSEDVTEAVTSISTGRNELEVQGK